MKSIQTVAITVAALATSAQGAVQRRQQGGLQAITTRGNAFYRGNDRFYIRGVAYQPGGAANAADPLLDMDTLRNDVSNMQELGINTIRIYTIDNSQNHDEAMKLLDDAGIYLALDANTPKYSLNRENADSLHASYNDVYLQSVFATIDAFAGYSMSLLRFSTWCNASLTGHNRQPPPILLRQRSHRHGREHKRSSLCQGSHPRYEALHRHPR
jgi:hypothetical protein